MELGVWIGAWSSMCGLELEELCVRRVRVREQTKNV